jgi:methyl-accepting chemotaxis protein
LAEEAKKIFSLLLNCIEHVIDGNGSWVVNTLSPSISSHLQSLSPQLHKDIVIPLSNLLKTLNDWLDHHFCTFDLTAANIHTIVNSLSLQTQTQAKTLRDVNANLHQLQAGLEGKAGSGVVASRLSRQSLP